MSLSQCVNWRWQNDVMGQSRLGGASCRSSNVRNAPLATVIPIAHTAPPPNYQSRFRAWVPFGRRPIERAMGFGITGVQKPTHFRTHEPQQTAFLFDHLVGDRE
jgi:hypothetical protein